MYNLRQVHPVARLRVAKSAIRWRARSQFPAHAAGVPARAGRRVAFLSLSAVALFATTFLGALPASAGRIFVDPAGQADLVTQGANNSLQFYWAKSANAWHHLQVAAPGTTHSAPSVFVRPNGTGEEAEVVAEGANNSLQYYWAPCPGSGCGPWHHAQVAVPGTTDSAPSMYLSAKGAVDIAAEGPANTLRFYWAISPINPWHPAQVATAGSTHCAPSIFVRAASPEDQADIAAQGPNNTLQYYWADRPGVGPPGPWHHAQAAGPGSTFCG